SADTPASEPNQAAARPLTPDNVRQIWREAVGRLEGLMADLAGSATQVELGSSNQLVVTFPAEYNSSKSYLERPEKTAQLEQVLVEVAGRKLRIDYKTTGKVKREVEKPRSQNSRQLVQESYKHPFVQAAIELFEAEVVAVQPPQRQTEPPGHTD
ncbi:MAG: hypothetical protein KDA60_12885, partial [Planctomycetales bacterium]|nr:hypothetical protein [Planctomycetales bacterium]